MFTVRRRGPYVTISLALVLALLISGTGQLTYSAPPPTEKQPLAQTGLSAGLIPTELPLAVTATPTPAATPTLSTVPQSPAGRHQVYLPLVFRAYSPAGPLPYLEWLARHHAFLNRTSRGKVSARTSPRALASNQEGFPEWSHPSTRISSAYGMAPAIAADEQGNLHVVWVHYLGNRWNIYYAKWDVQTGVWGPASRVNEN